MVDTPNLALPLVAAAQAQKHVTVNEAFRRLDAMVQLTVLDRDLAAPPSSPTEGDRYIVAGSPTGAWTGHSGDVAAYLDGDWLFFTAREGWAAWIADESVLAIYDGSAWVSLTAAAGIVGVADLATGAIVLLGVNTSADATNRLAVKSDAVLLSHDDVTPGTGDMRVTLNKSATAKDAGFVFQTGYSSRALFGLLGDDAFTLKTSPDGSTFRTVLTASGTDLNIGPSGSGLTQLLVGPHIVSTNFASGGSAMEISALIAGDRYAYFDFHASDSQPDYSSRFIRNPGANADLTLENVGTGHIRLKSAGTVRFNTGAADRVAVDASGNFAPAADNAYTCGGSGARWSAIWAANGTIQTSDERDKVDVERFGDDIAAGLVDAVDPITFKWRIGGKELRKVGERTVETGRLKAEYEEVEEDYEDLVDVDGGLQIVRGRRTTRRPAIERLPLLGADGSRALDAGGEPIEIGRIKMRPETVVEPIFEEVEVPGQRRHAGFLAQDLKAAMDSLGTDFGAWGLEDMNDPESRQWTRPDQLIPVLWAALRKTRADLSALRREMEASTSSRPSPSA